MHYKSRLTAASIAVAAAFATIPMDASAAPTVTFKAPTSGRTLSGAISASAACEVTGLRIDRVRFYLGSTALNTEESAPWNCTIDTRRFANGTHTLRAVAYDTAGASASTSVSVNIQNGTVTPTPTPTTTPSGAPTVAFTAPAAGGVLTGNVQGPPNCTVQGANIARVMFYINDVWTNTDGNLTNGLGCWIDTTKYRDGTYTLKAVAYNAAGQTATVTHPVTIRNSTTSTPTPTPTTTNKAPTVSFVAPAAGATISGQINSTTCAVNAADDKAVSKVDFYVGQTLVSSKAAAPWQCAIDTTKFANGTHTLMAVARDAEGLSATTQRSVTITNTTTTTPTPAPTTGSSTLDAADIIGSARGDVPFSNQKGYSSQVLGTHTSVSSIPEAGIHGGTLSNGETLRMGKETDPLNSAKKVLSFQLSYSDPNTSGSKRSEISFSPNVEMNKVYWVAFRAYVRDWGSESSEGLFGTQLHSGDNSRGLSPSFGIYMSGARNFRVETRYSTASSPSSSNSITQKHGDHPIKFGQWVDFVIKFKHNTSGQGFLQAWVDGTQIVDYKGNLGFNTPGYKDYFKFGLYNWASFKTPRKVMLHAPTMVLDPTGSKYNAAALRAHVQK